jgi:uncharacterized metal-binding protein
VYWVLSTLKSGRWSLRRFLLLPAIAAMIVMLLRIPFPTTFGLYASNWPWKDRLQNAFIAYPIILFVVDLIRLFRMRSWKTLFIWVALGVLIGAGWVAVTMIDAHRNFAPDERLLIAAWYIPLAAGYYITALLSMIYHGVYGLVQLMRGEKKGASGAG